MQLVVYYRNVILPRPRFWPQYRFALRGHSLTLEIDIFVFDNAYILRIMC